jgi:hypothetical protein
VQNPTQALKSVKGSGNSFDLNPKWERTLPSFDNFSYKIAEGRQSSFQLGVLIKGISQAFN